RSAHPGSRGLSRTLLVTLDARRTGHRRAPPGRPPAHRQPHAGCRRRPGREGVRRRREPRTGPGHAMTNPERLESFELPAPTVWPMVVALGVTLGFSGLVTHFAVSVVGIVLALVGGVGWWRQVLPAERVEHVPVPPAQGIPPWATTTPRSVERFAFGDD